MESIERTNEDVLIGLLRAIEQEYLNEETNIDSKLAMISLLSWLNTDIYNNFSMMMTLVSKICALHPTAYPMLRKTILLEMSNR